MFLICRTCTPERRANQQFRLDENNQIVLLSVSYVIIVIVIIIINLWLFY